MDFSSLRVKLIAKFTSSRQGRWGVRETEEHVRCQNANLSMSLSVRTFSFKAQGMEFFILK